jgi:hypothetical protein
MAFAHISTWNGQFVRAERTGGPLRTARPDCTTIATAAAGSLVRNRGETA